MWETKDRRVYGLSFHPTKSWILASLRGGAIQLWDYQKRNLIKTFEEHEESVRSVDFHKSKPFFVSGGDDSKVKVWNYETGKCFLTLEGHKDWLRTVQFHHSLRRIVSASDDTTVRIWNWRIKSNGRGKSCLFVLDDHNHSVMCASFHPKEDDLVLTASLDQTVRIWDIGGGIPLVRHTLVHRGGVTWASFHPTLPHIVSGSEDSQVKLWRIDETEASELATLRGHGDTVSSVMFARQDIIVSSSKDKSIRVWDATKRTEIQTFSYAHYRFRILTVHPEVGLLAAGHGKGLILFKLGRKRPAFALNGDSLLYVKESSLRLYKYSTQKDSQLLPIRRPGTPRLNENPRTLSYSPDELAVLICSHLVGGSYVLYIIPKEDVLGRSDVVIDAKRGEGGSAVFISPNRFAVLKSTTEVQVMNLENEVVERSSLPFPVDAIFYAGTGKLLCSSEDRVVLFDPQQSRVLGELHTPSLVRHVVWANDMESVALLSRYAITIASKKLVLQCTLKEPIPVKSGAWDDNGAFIYTSSTDIKYWRPHGDSKIIQTMDIPIYITKVSGDTIFCLDQDGKNTAITINTSRVSKKRKAESDGDTTMRTIDDSAKNDSQPFPGEADNSRAKRRKIDDKFSETPTEISWDMENAPVPSGFPPEKVYPNILRSLREAKIMGPVKITGYVGYLNSHVPAGLDPRIEIKRANLYNRPVNSKYDQAADRKLIKDIQIWLEKKETARNIMFITGDCGFSSVVEDLKKSGHNILLAYVQGLEKNTSAEIRKLADFFWEWRDLLHHIPDGLSARERKAKRYKKKGKKKISRERKAKKDKKRKEKKREEKERKEKEKGGC